MRTQTIALALTLIAGGAQAAGPLYTTDTNPPVPLKILLLLDRYLKLFQIKSQLQFKRCFETPLLKAFKS